MEVPLQKVVYIPKFWQVLKVAWVTYFSLVLLFWYLLYKLIFKYVIKSGTFDCVIADDYPIPDVQGMVLKK
jgi:hypothetical protein